MKSKIPKFHILFFSDYSLMGTVFGAIMCAIAGTAVLFAGDPKFAIGFIFYTISILCILLFSRRIHRLRSLFLYGVSVKATVSRVSVLSMKHTICYCRLEYSYSLNGEKYTSHSILSIPLNEVSSYKGKTITIVVHPKRPHFSINQDSLDKTIFRFGLLNSLLLAIKKRLSQSKDDDDSGDGI